MSAASSKLIITLKEYLLIALGIFLYCISWTSFLIPKGIAGGGVTGLATVLHYATNGFIPVSGAYLVINLILVGLGTLILGKGFGFKTIYCILLATLFFQFLPDLIPWVTDVEEPFINALLGGLIAALGISIVFMQGGSTGGTDIVALVISKYREVSPGRVFLYCDLIIIGSIIFLPDRGMKDVVYGYIQMITFSLFLDMLLIGSKQSIQVMIFSEKYKEIADELLEATGRGVSVFTTVGWYTREERKMLLITARKHQLGIITKIIKNIDKSAFISVTQAMSVYGRGFDEIKSGGKIEWKKNKKEQKS